jgi:hypothetical protein
VSDSDDLKAALASLPDAHFRKVRDAYFKAAEGLAALNSALLVASGITMPKAFALALIEEGDIAAAAHRAFAKSELGRYV